MTNKLVVIVNSPKVPKIKKILLYEMKFLVPNYSYLHNPRLKGYRLQIPVLSVLFPQLNLLTPPTNKIPWYATVGQCHSIWIFLSLWFVTNLKLSLAISFSKVAVTCELIQKLNCWPVNLSITLCSKCN